MNGFDSSTRDGLKSLEPNYRYKAFMTIMVLCSSFYFMGTTGKSIDANVGIVLVPTVVVLAYILIIRRVRFRTIVLLHGLLIASLIIICYYAVGGGLGSVVNNISAVAYIFLFSQLNFGRDQYKYLSKALIVLQGYLGLYCLFFGLHDGLIGVFNSNSIGLQLLINLIYIDMYIHGRRRWTKYLINLISIALIIYTRSRTPLIIGSIAILFVLYNKKHLIKPVFFKIGYWFICLGGVAFPIAYTKLFSMYDSPIVTALRIWMKQYLHKDLFTGREYIWGEALERLMSSSKSFLLGIGSHYSEEAGGNFHNSYLSIMICCGLITYFLFALYLYSFFSKGGFSTHSIQRSRLLYLALMISGITESTLFTGHFAILSYMLLCSTNTCEPLEELQ